MQSKERGRKCCNTVTPVKSTPSSILLPTSREEPPRHGRTGDLAEQCYLLNVRQIMYGIQSVAAELGGQVSTCENRQNHLL